MFVISLFCEGEKDSNLKKLQLLISLADGKPIEVNQTKSDKDETDRPALAFRENCKERKIFILSLTEARRLRNLFSAKMTVTCLFKSHLPTSLIN